MCEPDAADPRTVNPEVETFAAPKTWTASGKGESLEGIQALHLVYSTMSPNFARDCTQMGQSVRKSEGSKMRTTSPTYGKKLYNLCWVSVLNVVFNLLEKVVNCDT